MRPARGRQDGEGVRGSWVVHAGEGIEIASLARRLTLAFWSMKGGWGLASLDLDVLKRDNTNYNPT